MDEDHYTELGVSTDADPAVIRAAYLALIRLHHPDSAPDGSARVAAEARTKRLNAAYAVLGDADRRAAYDRKRLRPRPPLPTPAGSGLRAGAAVRRPAKRRGPSLHDRRERLRRVRLVSVGLALAALALIFSAFVGVVGLVRPKLPDWMAREAPAADTIAYDEASAAAVTEDVMLPWPGVAGDEPRTMTAEGLRLTFQPVEAGVVPVLEVSDQGGPALRLEGSVELSSDRVNLFGIGRLEGSGRPAVLVLATPVSEDCCVDVRVVFRDRGRLRVARIGQVPSAVAERFPADWNEDGRREWITPDHRFVAAFGPSSPPPPRILTFRDGAARDLSASGDYGEVFSNHLGPAQRLCTLGSSGACAAFVASAARIDRVEWAWDIMLRNYDRDPVHGGADSPAFPDRVRAFLVGAGYVDNGSRLITPPQATN